MMMRAALLGILTFIALASATQAAPAGARCNPTDRRGDMALYPGEANVPTSNNLRRKPGAAVFAMGTPLLVEGKVLDQNCVPVYGAIVELWQANAMGTYQTKGRSKVADPNFAGSGRVSSANTGAYSFLTIVPGVSGKSSPRLHLRVRHPDFQDLVTEISLGADAPSAKKRGIFVFPQPVDPNNPEAGQRLVFDLVLRGSQPYRTY